MLIDEKQPYKIDKPINEENDLDFHVNMSFFEWVYKEHGLHSDFIMENYLPCIPIYESEELQHATQENLHELLGKYSSPNDHYLYPVIDLDNGWPEYLNRLTINEAQNFFAFGSLCDGKYAISNYEEVAATNPGAKQDLSWLDWDADWTEDLN